MTMRDQVVVDASAMVDLLLENDVGREVRARVREHALHSAAHLDAEVLSALARLHRAGSLSPRRVAAALSRLAGAPITRHHLPSLVEGAWRRRANLQLADALYVELGQRLRLPVITTDRRLAAAVPSAELIDG